MFGFERITRGTTEAEPRRSRTRWLLGTMVLAGGLIAAACGSGTPELRPRRLAQLVVVIEVHDDDGGPEHHHDHGRRHHADDGRRRQHDADDGQGQHDAGHDQDRHHHGADGGTPSANNALGGANDFNTPAASLTGAGSTFDQPLFARQFYDYNKANSKVTVNYASVGSGTGETDILAGSVNFGASDVPEPAGTTGRAAPSCRCPSCSVGSPWPTTNRAWARTST